MTGRRRRCGSVARKEEEAHRVDVDGGRLAVRVVGTGPDVVLVHGPLVSSHVWDRVVPLLAGHVRLVLPDLPLGAHRIPLGADADRSSPPTPPAWPG